MFALELEVRTYGVVGGSPKASHFTHKDWVVATQDCDLDQTLIDSPETAIELRMVTDGSSPDGGIRSRWFGVAKGKRTRSDAPRLHVAGTVLSLETAVTSRTAMDSDRARAFKTWLGYRYDRPAVPPEYLNASRAIAELVARGDASGMHNQLHDVLMSFRDGFAAEEGPKVVDVFLVTTDDADQSAVKAWFTQSAFDLLDQGAAQIGRVVPLTRAAVSVELVENSYSADLSSMTYKSKGIVGPTRR